MNKSSENAKSCSLPMAHGLALITVNAMVCILGSFGNLLLCFAIANHPLLRRTSNYLLFSLAIADLFVTMVCEPVLLEIFYNRTFFSRMQSKPGKAVSSHSQSFLLRFSDPLSLDPCGSVYRRCVPSSPQNFHEEMRTCDFAHSFLGTTDFSSCFDGCPSTVLSQKVHGDDIVFLELLRHHLFILYDRSISAQVQEEKKGPKSPYGFHKVYFAQRGPCCLHFSYCNRRFYSLLGSSKDYEVSHKYDAKQPFVHVAPDLGSVKLSHEFSDLLCKNPRLQRCIRKYLSKDVSLVEFGDALEFVLDVIYQT